MADLTLYHASPSRSSIVLWMLEELGQPYDVKLIKLSEGDNLKPGFLAINPMGKVPALAHKGTVITEAAAICTYLADEFPQAKLNVPVGTPARGIYLKWLFFGPGCVEPAMIDRAAPRKEEARRGMLGYGTFDTTMDTVAKAIEKGPWLMGEQFTAADVYLFTITSWAGHVGLDLSRFTALAAFQQLVASRPAVQAALEAEGLLAKAA